MLSTKANAQLGMKPRPHGQLTVDECNATHTEKEEQSLNRAISTEQELAV